jgi:hypothetical protein
MAGGLAQVGILAVLTVVALPCCFFTLLALLDRFERTLTPDASNFLATTEPKQVAGALTDPGMRAVIEEPVGADVVTLPVAAAVSPAIPSAATG